jgi:hypothetical protein
MTTPTLKDIQNTLQQLLDADRPVVIALKGGWGEGKTYFWKESIQKHRKKVSYASVFGAASILEIRERVLLASIPLPSPGSDKGRFRPVMDILQTAGSYISSIARGFGISPPTSLAIRLLEATLLRDDRVVCLDDVERLSSSIGAETLLGYITELRDDRELKVVLIYNDEAIAESPITREMFARYREKVVDREIRFVHDLDAIVSIVFDSVPPISTHAPVIDELKRRCRVLNVTNIRLLLKARYYFEELVRVLPNDAPADFLNAMLHSLLLYIWIHFGRHKYPVLTWDFIEDYAQVRYLLGDAKKVPEAEQDAHKLLNSYGYSMTDDLDRTLLRFLRTDVLDSSALKEQYGLWHDTLSKAKLENAFSEVWVKYYHGTFRDNANEFCDALIGATRAFLPHITGPNFDEVLVKLDQLGRSREADQLLTEFVKLRQETIRSYHRSFRPEPVRYPKLAAILRGAEEAQKRDDRPLVDVIASACSAEFLSADDRRRLGKVSPEEFIRFFVDQDQERVTGKLRTLYKNVSGIGNPDSDEKAIMSALQAAIRDIAGRSTLNRLRMESLGFRELLDQPNDASTTSAGRPTGPGATSGATYYKAPQKDREGLNQTESFNDLPSLIVFLGIQRMAAEREASDNRISCNFNFNRTFLLCNGIQQRPFTSPS